VDVLKIATEGRRIDPVRNVERLWLEVTAHGNGCSIEGHRVAGTEVTDTGPAFVPTRIEIYEDHLDAVLERVRTEAHRAAYQAAEIDCVNETQNWIDAKGREYRRRLESKAPHDRARMLHMECNLRPAHFLAAKGYRTGIPPLESCHVIHPRTGAKIDAREFQKLDVEKRREWIVDAPATPQNQSQRANEHLAETLERVLSKFANKQR
jgi:hypothetical protein